MIEYVPLSENILNTAVRITRTIVSMLRCSSIDPDITDINQSAAKFVITVRIPARCIAQLPAQYRRINQIIDSVYFPDGARLEKFMASKSRSFTVRNIRRPQCMNARCVQSARKTAFCIVNKRDLVRLSVFLIAWILLLSEDNALVPPVIQMIQRC